MRYEVMFSNREFAHITHTVCLSDVKDGFWVTKDGQFTMGSDCYSFILPHMIKSILINRETEETKG
jgi:hypothetical protein